jgi:hypothetical protein
MCLFHEELVDGLDLQGVNHRVLVRISRQFDT